MISFIRENLLKASDTVVHDDEPRTTDESLTPMIENMTVLIWLQKVHPRLPSVVKQKYATELKNKTLFNLKPEISMAISSLLEDTQSNSTGLNRLSGRPEYKRNFKSNNTQRDRGFRENRFSRQSPQHSNRRLPPNCALCKQAGRQNTAHYMSKCNFLPESDKKYMSMTRQIKGLLNDCDKSEEEDNNYDTQPQDNYV